MEAMRCLPLSDAVYRQLTTGAKHTSERQARRAPGGVSCR
jgi:hypothetical protein